MNGYSSIHVEVVYVSSDIANNFNEIYIIVLMSLSYLYERCDDICECRKGALYSC